MNFIYEGMSSEEIAAKKAELELELECAQIEHEFESVQMMHELRLKDIEQKILLENCTLEEVADLYANEQDLFTEAEGGILSKLIAWLSGIVKAIFGITSNTKVDPAEKNDMIELNTDVKGLNTGAKTVLDNLRNMTKIKDPNTGEIKLSAIVFNGVAAAGAVTGIKALINAVSKKTKISKGEAKTESDSLAKISNDITAELKRINADLNEKASKGDVSEIGTLIKKINSVVEDIQAKIGGATASNKSDENNDGDANASNTNGDGNSDDGGKNSSDGSNKKDDKAAEGKNASDDSNSGEKYNKNDIGYIRVKDNPSLSLNARKQAVIDKLKKDAKINERNQALCSVADFNKYYLGRLDTMQSWLQDNGKFKEADHKAIEAIINAIKNMNIRNVPAEDKSEGVIEFAMNKGKGDWSDIADANLAAQVGYDPDANTVTCDQKTLDKYKKYYQNLMSTQTQGTRPYNACKSAYDKLANVKAAKSADNGQNNNSGSDKYDTEVRKRLQVKSDKRVNGDFITVSKESYEKYREELELIKKDNDNKASQAAIKKLALVDKYYNSTEKAAKTLAEINKNKPAGSKIKLPIWSLSSEELTNVDKQVRGEFGISEEGDKFKSSLSKNAYTEKLKKLQKAINSAADGSEAKVSLTRKYNHAKNYYENIYGSGGKASMGDLDSVADSAKAANDAKMKANMSADEQAELAKQSKLQSTHTVTDAEFADYIGKLFGATPSKGAKSLTDDYTYPAGTAKDKYAVGLVALNQLINQARHAILSQSQYDALSKKGDKLAKARIRAHDYFLDIKPILDKVHDSLTQIKPNKDMAKNQKEMTALKIKSADVNKAAEAILLSIPEYKDYADNVLDDKTNRSAA